MNIAILSKLYPSNENLYGGMYVHARAREYKKLGHTCNVYKLNKNKKDYREYKFENIQVYEGNKYFLKEKMNKNAFDIIALHAPSPDEKYFILKNFSNSKVICWMHGHDSLSGAFTYFYTGSKFLYPLKFLLRLKEDIKKIVSWREFIKHFNPKVIVVSHWMKKEAESFLKLNLDNTIMIPNLVDEDIFKFKQRKGKIKKILCLRSHSSKKFALDIVIKAFSNSKFQLDLYGIGKNIGENKKLAKLVNANVVFIEKLFEHNEIIDMFDSYDLAVMPTRLDSQGVLVCEMNMAGLPVITSDILGNKEYETRGTIRLDNTNFKIEDRIEDINKNNKLEEMSKYAHIDMLNIASKNITIPKEIMEMRKLI